MMDIRAITADSSVQRMGTRKETMDPINFDGAGLPQRISQTLIKANAVVAVVFLAIGGLFGLTVALTRWQAIHLLPAEWFYLALTAHGFDVLLVWILFFEVALLYFASAVLFGMAIGAWQRASGRGRS